MRPGRPPVVGPPPVVGALSLAGALLASGLLAAGCGAEGSATPAEAERVDSAGVEVVVNRPPPDEAPPVWTVGPATLSIGVVEGAPEDQLFQVRGARRLDDGRIVVANGGTHEIRIYGPDGAHRRSLGGEGEGPGEFQMIAEMWRYAGDSLAVWDIRRRYMSIFDADDGYVRGYRLDPLGGEGFPNPLAVLPDGRPLARQGQVMGSAEVGTGVRRSPATVFLGSAEGAPGDTLGSFPGSEAYMLAGEGFISFRSIPFGRGFHTAVAGNRVAVGNDDAYSIRLYHADGTLERVVRLERPLRTVGSGDFEAVRDEAVAGIEDETWRDRTREMFEAMPRRESLPAYGSLLTDPAGNLWVEESRTPSEEQPVWLVYRPDGQLAGRVETPPGLEISEIGEDYVLGVRTDDLEVEYVELHPLERAGGG